MIEKKRYVVALLILSLSLLAMAVDTRVGEGVVLRPQPTSQPPKLDGVLDDAVWQCPPLVAGPFILNNPVYGEVLPQKTEIWLTYDQKNLYFAFYCHDDMPDKIKGTMTKRDSIFNEDWIDVDIDTMGSRQCTYEHACNPLGVQGDLVQSVQGGESLDPDWVWYSAGKVVADGYIVETRIPLSSLKYKSGKNVIMNMGFYRNIPHSSANSSWPQQDRNKGYFNSLAPVEFAQLDSQLRLEALPALTYGSIWDRETPQKWSPADDSLQAGLGIKYGINSSTTAELTINPDFSQVETDQLQIVANLRYPVFNSEKRPFFMEIANQFGLAATGDTNLGVAVHTRTIVDPAWGAKLTGESGRLFFGLLAAGDEWPGQTWSEGTNPDQGRNANFYIARAKYGLGGDNYAGLLYSGREFGEEYNRVVGADLRFRLGGRHNFSFNGLYTFSQALETSVKSSAGSATAMYTYSQKPLDLLFCAEDYGKDFRMDTAYYLRTGITQFTGLVNPHFYPRWKGLAWVRRVNVNLYGTFTHDKFTGQDDLYLQSGVSVNMPWQASLSMRYIFSREYYAGRGFDQNSFAMNGGIQATNWLTLNGSLTVGRAIRYDPSDPFLGNSTTFSVSTTLQPSDNLAQSFNFTRQVFNRLAGGGRVLAQDILVSRTTYQFNRYFFLRALVQYDSYRRRVISDILASCTVIPGTVLHLGYGSLHQKRLWTGTDWQTNFIDGQYYQLRQSLFFKVSYLFQF
jgi:hypothetical protein